MAFARGVFPSARLARKFPFSVDGIPAQISRLHQAPKSFTNIRRNRMPVMQFVFGHYKFTVGIEDNEIRIVSRCDSTFVPSATGQSSRFSGHPAGQIEQGESSTAGFCPH